MVKTVIENLYREIIVEIVTVWKKIIIQYNTNF